MARIASLGMALYIWVWHHIPGYGIVYLGRHCTPMYGIASPGMALHLRVQHCISGYGIASLGTALHLWVRHCISGYSIASLGTALHLRVRHCISGYGIASPSTALHLQVRHCISKYGIASPGTALHLQVRHCIPTYSVVSSSIKECEPEVVPKSCRSRIGIYSETCSYTGVTRCEHYFAFVCIVEFDIVLYAKLLKICQYFEEFALLMQTVSTFFFLYSCFDLILLFYNMNITILVCFGQRYF